MYDVLELGTMCSPVGNFRMELHMVTPSPSIPACSSPAPSGLAAVVAHAAQSCSGAGIPLQTSWLVTVRFPASSVNPERFPGGVHAFRWSKKSDALKCEREFSLPGSSAQVAITECRGYHTFSGWVDAS